MRDILTCPWLHRTPANNCNADCSSCTSRKYDLALAPFRLIAIPNRLELMGRPDPYNTLPNGEARLVFALTDGPADDPASQPLTMTVIFEYEVPPSYTPKQWASFWHDLAKHPSFDEAYKTDLAALTERYVGRDANPTAQNGSAIARIRTNERLFNNWNWQLRQFHLDATGHFGSVAVTNSPDRTLNGTPRLVDWVKANAEAIRSDKHLLIPSMHGPAADFAVNRWNVPGVDEPTRKAFATATCNGCHLVETPSIDVAFHVSPFRSGVEKLSRFVNDPANPTNDDLGKRAVHMRSVLCKP
jgi:hypothetical protein